MAESKASKDAERSWRTSLWGLAKWAALAYAAVALLVFLFQRRLQYFPDPDDPPLPPGDTYRGIERVDLAASDGVRLRAWHWPGTRSETIVLFHGNAGNRAHRIGWIERFHDQGYGAFLLDYRGYGGSGGSPTEEGLYLDGEAALTWLAARGPGPLIYFGESLGCGVAIEMALRRAPAKLILHAPYTSLADVGQRAYPFLPVKLLMLDRYDCMGKIGRVACPLLVIHGARDGVIPSVFGERLFRGAPEPKRWLLLPHAGHNDLPWADGYEEAVLEFLSIRSPVSG